MPIQVHGPCGHSFEAEERFAGGVVNCPACGRATAVPGLRDPFWSAIVVLAVAGWIVASALAAWVAGPVAGLAVAAGLALVLWLVSLAL